MKKVLFIGMFLMLSACQNNPQQNSNHLAERTQHTEVAPCTNGFDDVNVCELRS